MKSAKIFLFLFLAGALITGCATTQGGYGDEYENGTTKRVGNRVYVDDPFYGNVVLERDPFTGRYYDVTNGYGGLSSPYYNGWNNSRGFRNYPNNRVYRGSRNTNLQKPAQGDVQRSREEARRKVLGN